MVKILTGEEFKKSSLIIEKFKKPIDGKVMFVIIAFVLYRVWGIINPDIVLDPYWDFAVDLVILIVCAWILIVSCVKI